MPAGRASQRNERGCIDTNGWPLDRGRVACCLCGWQASVWWLCVATATERTKERYSQEAHAGPRHAHSPHRHNMGTHHRILTAERPQVSRVGLFASRSRPAPIVRPAGLVC